MSTAATATSVFPTGAFSSIDYSKISLNYWWLRSPETSIVSIAWFVRSDGNVSYFMNSGVDSDSYGGACNRRTRISVLMRIAPIRMVTSTSTSTMPRIPTVFSPRTDNHTNYAWPVYPSGSVDRGYDDFTIDFSCGRKDRRSQATIMVDI